MPIRPHDVATPLAGRTARRLAAHGWSTDDVRAVQELSGERAGGVLASVLRDEWPDRRPQTVLAWLRVGGRPLLEAMDQPDQHRRQVQGMACWSRTYGELGPLGHAAGLTLPEAAHLLAAGLLTRALLEERSAAREPEPVLASWSDALRS